MTRILLLFVLAMSCGGGDDPSVPPPGNGGGTPFWTQLDFSQAEDLGYQPRYRSDTERVPPGQITLVDVTEEAGLGNAVSGGNIHGVGAAFADINGDDLPDIVVVGGKTIINEQLFPPLLYLNQGDGTFRDATAESGLAAILDGRDCYSVAAGDYDGDGDRDLYVGAQPTDVLLRNCTDGSGVCFEDATTVAGAGGPPSDSSLTVTGSGKIVSFGDFDSDGDLDLVSASKTLPRPYAYLLRNNGDGTFTDISVETEVRAARSGNPCAVMWSDYDNDGDPDLWIWNDRGGHILLRNEAGERFEDVTELSGLDQVGIRNPMGIDAADIDHDGDLDYYISNIKNNPLLRNNGDGTFTDITHSAGTAGEYGWGLAFEDFNNDSFADIFVAQEDNMPNLLFQNLGVVPSVFHRIEIPRIAAIHRGNAHNVAVAFADYNRDGKVDVLTAMTDGSRVTLYRNDTDMGSNQWLHVAVRDADAGESTEGIGARVAVKTGDLIQFRDITGGSSRASQNQLSVRFGLRNYTGAEWVAVVWPSGRQIIVTGVEGGQRLVLPRPQ
ncbi:MAG: CRTAC1 family protein [Proteobacteria bacterium]|nr:CRTAC1 family protein [Pseudomonadota bacterium]